MSHLHIVLLVGAVFFLGFAFMALNVLAWRHAFALLHYDSGAQVVSKPHALSRRQKAQVLLDGIRIPRPIGYRTPSDFSLLFEPIRIPTASNLKLGAWLCPTVGSHTLVILFHGYAQDKSSLLEEAAAFHELGLSCLLVDFRGSGESSGSHTTIGVEEGEDVAAAYAYARKRFSHSSIILFGQSMGAAAILRAVEHEKEMRPDALILESVFDSMYQTAINRFELHNMPAFLNARLLLFWGGRQFGFNPFRHNPADYARSVCCPALFLQGGADERARPQDARRVYDAIPGPDKEYCEFEDHGHEASVIRHPKAWRETALAFFTKYDLLRR